VTFFHHRPPRVPDQPGAVLCALADIPDGAGKGFELEADDGSLRAIFVVRQGARVFGYLNVCPHAGTPLDLQPDTFLAPDGDALQCSTHGARFAIEDGRCLAGPCRGRGLTPVAVHLDDDGRIRLSAA